MISFEHSMQGASVMYRVEPSQLFALFATLVMALASAWSTYDLVLPLSSSHIFSKPEGVPLYPSDMIILSLTISAPTLRRTQYEFSAQMRAMRR